MSTFYKYFSKISFIFVTAYALLGIVLIAFYNIGFINELLEPLKIFHLVLPVLAIVVGFSWPFFWVIAIGALIARIIHYVRSKPAENKKYICETVLYTVFSVIGMIGIYAMYYEKFGNPFN